MPLEGVQALRDFMLDFMSQHRNRETLSAG
jgi:hypothetical protein